MGNIQAADALELFKTLQTHDLDDLEEPKPEDGSSGEFTIQSIWETLDKLGDIIIIIDKVDEPRIRKGLSTIKSRINFKLKGAGIPTDSSTLEFIVHPNEKGILGHDQVKLQIVLKKRQRIKLHKFIVPK